MARTAHTFRDAGNRQNPAGLRSFALGPDRALYLAAERGPAEARTGTLSRRYARRYRSVGYVVAIGPNWSICAPGHLGDRAGRCAVVLMGNPRLGGGRPACDSGVPRAVADEDEHG
jgi:hypothetical protein